MFNKSCENTTTTQIVYSTDTLWIESDSVVHTVEKPSVVKIVHILDTVLLDSSGLKDSVFREANLYNETWTDTNGVFTVSSTVSGELLKQSLLYKLSPRSVITNTTTIKETVFPKHAGYIGIAADPFSQIVYIKTDFLIDKYMLTAGASSYQKKPVGFIGISLRLFKR